MNTECKKCGYNSDGLDYCESCEIQHMKDTYSGKTPSKYGKVVREYYKNHSGDIGWLFAAMDEVDIKQRKEYIATLPNDPIWDKGL